MPIIQSRVRIDYVEKIIVRQSKGIEGTFYYIMKAIEDPKCRARLLVPLSVFMMIIGLGMMLPGGGSAHWCNASYRRNLVTSEGSWC